MLKKPILHSLLFNFPITVFPTFGTFFCKSINAVPKSMKNKNLIHN